MEWPPSGVAWFSPTLYLGLVLVESRADEEAARLVGQTLLQLEAVPAGQWTALVQRAAVSLALWRGDPADAMAVADREWERVLDTDDPGQIALAASTCLEAAAAASEDSRSRRDWAGVAAAGQFAQKVLPEAEQRLAASSLSRSLGARREAELHLDVARAHLAAPARPRQRGCLGSPRAGLGRGPRPVPAGQGALVAGAGNAAVDGIEARCARRPPRGVAHRRRAAGAPAAAVGASGWRCERAFRCPARTASRREVEAAQGAGARRVVAVAARRELEGVGAGPSDQARTATGRAIAERLRPAEGGTGEERFGLSPREQEVLSVLVDGRTNREIAERLFISERTVAVHVRRILSKLDVSGRVQAAGLAIRLGLVPERPSDRATPTGGGRR